MILEYIGVYFVNFVNTLVHFIHGTWFFCFSLVAMSRQRHACLDQWCDTCRGLGTWDGLNVWFFVRCQDREEAVGLYYAANNLMSLTFLSCIVWRITHQVDNWKRVRKAVGYVADDQGENIVTWHLNILNTIDVLVIQGWLAYRCFWYWYCGHRAQQMHNRKTWLGRQAWLYLFMSSCIIWVCLKIGYIPNYSHLIIRIYNDH